MAVFTQLELLPIAYLLIVLWVVCANVLAKLLSKPLVNATHGLLHDFLAWRINIHVTGDEIEGHLFERRLIQGLNIRLLFTLIDVRSWLCVGPLTPVPLEVLNIHQQTYPEKFWSGCPPNRVN